MARSLFRVPSDRRHPRSICNVLTTDAATTGILSGTDGRIDPLLSLFGPLHGIRGFGNGTGGRTVHKNFSPFQSTSPARDADDIADDGLPGRPGHARCSTVTFCSPPGPDTGFRASSQVVNSSLASLLRTVLRRLLLRQVLYVG